MATNELSRTRVAVLVLSCAGLALAGSSIRAGAQIAPVATSENASDALSRYLRVLATSPRDFQALVGAGRAALELGDTQAAAGFYGRADEVWPTSPLPQIGIGTATALDGDAQGALAHFTRAERLGARPVTMGSGRGLAFDLLGRHAEAQADYRSALTGSDANEARRRLALSLAVTGDKAGAVETLAPLLARRDPAAARTRALVLALTGDHAGARQAIEWSMPGGWAQMAPFLGRLGTLNSAQKAAAVHLGIFPGSGAVPASPNALPSTAQQDRLAAIEELLRGQQVPPGSAPTPIPVPQQQVVARPPAPQVVTTAASTVAVATPQRRRFWVQIGSGPDATALPDQFRRIKARSENLLDGISGYVADEVGRARLLVGPFRDADDARIFAEDLESVSVNASSWVSPEGQPIRKISSE